MRIGCLLHLPTDATDGVWLSKLSLPKVAMKVALNLTSNDKWLAGLWVGQCFDERCDNMWCMTVWRLGRGGCPDMGFEHGVRDNIYESIYPFIYRRHLLCSILVIFTAWQSVRTSPGLQVPINANKYIFYSMEWDLLKHGTEIPSRLLQIGALMTRRSLVGAMTQANLWTTPGLHASITIPLSPPSPSCLFCLRSRLVSTICSQIKHEHTEFSITRTTTTCSPTRCLDPLSLHARSVSVPLLHDPYDLLLRPTCLN